MHPETLRKALGFWAQGRENLSDTVSLGSPVVAVKLEHCNPHSLLRYSIMDHSTYNPKPMFQLSGVRCRALVMRASAAQQNS